MASTPSVHSWETASNCPYNWPMVMDLGFYHTNLFISNEKIFSTLSTSSALLLLILQKTWLFTWIMGTTLDHLLSWGNLSDRSPNTSANTYMQVIKKIYWTRKIKVSIVHAYLPSTALAGEWQSNDHEAVAHHHHIIDLHYFVPEIFLKVVYKLFEQNVQKY